MKRAGRINPSFVIIGAAVCSVFCALLPLNPISWALTALIASVLAYIYLTERNIILFVYVIPAYFLSVLLTGLWGVSVLATISYPISMLLIIAVTKGMKRTSTISLAAGGGAFFIISAAILGAYESYGGFIASEILADTHEKILSILEGLTLLMPRIQSMRFSPEEIDLITNVVFYASPAFIVLISMGISYLATTFIKLWLKTGKVYYDYFSNDWGIRANFTAALVYILAVLTLFFTAWSGINAIFVTAINITVVLTPLMLIAGIRKLYVFLARRDSVVLTIAVITAVIALAAINLLIPVVVVSVYGVAMIIMGGLRLIVLTNLK